jgi:hypothetical protein
MFSARLLLCNPPLGPTLQSRTFIRRRTGTVKRADIPSRTPPYEGPAGHFGCRTTRESITTTKTICCQVRGARSSDIWRTMHTTHAQRVCSVRIDLKEAESGMHRRSPPAGLQPWVRNFDRLFRPDTPACSDERRGKNRERLPLDPVLVVSSSSWTPRTLKFFHLAAQKFVPRKQCILTFSRRVRE